MPDPARSPQIGDVSRIPGAKGQPPSEVKGPSFDTMPWLHTTKPNTDYEDKGGNPLQETAPMTPKVFHGDNNTALTDLMGKTANEINGGKTIFDGGGTG